MESIPINYIHVANRLRQIRESLNLSQREIATKIGISKAYWSALERGDRTPSAFILNALKSILDISTNWLLFGEGIPSEKDFKVNDTFISEEIGKKISEVTHVYHRIDNLLDLFEKHFKDDLSEINSYAEKLLIPISHVESQGFKLKVRPDLIAQTEVIKLLDELIVNLTKDFDEIFNQYYLNTMHPRKRKSFEAPNNVKWW